MNMFINGKHNDCQGNTWKYLPYEGISGEEWKPVIISEKVTGYEVSDNGNVRNHQGRLLPGSLKNGYFSVNLKTVQDGVSVTKHYLIHRLVATAFCENHDPLNKTVVNHRDSDKKNNKESNLEWVTHQENTQHYFKTTTK
jgi:hypothetical protein